MSGGNRLTWGVITAMPGVLESTAISTAAASTPAAPPGSSVTWPASTKVRKRHPPAHTWPGRRCRPGPPPSPGAADQATVLPAFPRPMWAPSRLLWTRPPITSATGPRPVRTALTSHAGTASSACGRRWPTTAWRPGYCRPARPPHPRRMARSPRPAACLRTAPSPRPRRRRRPGSDRQRREGDPKRERQLKAQGGMSRRCPECGVKPRTAPHQASERTRPA